MCRQKDFFLIDDHPLNFYCPRHPKGLRGVEKMQPARPLSVLVTIWIEASLGTQYWEGLCPSHTGCLWESRRAWISLPAIELSYAVCGPWVTADRTTYGHWYQIGTIALSVFLFPGPNTKPVLPLGINPGMVQRELRPCLKVVWWWWGVGRYK